MFVDQRRDRPVRYLEWRIRLMGAGALIALIAMYYRARWMIWVAVAVLVAGFLLRFLPAHGEGAFEEDADDDPEKHEE